MGEEGGRRGAQRSVIRDAQPSAFEALSPMPFTPDLAIGTRFSLAIRFVS